MLLSFIRYPSQGLAANEFQTSRYADGEGELRLTTIGLFPEKIWATLSIVAGLGIYAFYILCGILSMTKIEHQPPISLPLNMDEEVGYGFCADS